MNNLIKENVSSSGIQLSKGKQTIKLLILFSILGLLIVLSFIMLGCLILSRIKGNFCFVIIILFLRDYLGLRADNIYTKTSNINLDENKATLEQ